MKRRDFLKILGAAPAVAAVPALAKSEEIAITPDMEWRRISQTKFYPAKPMTATEVEKTYSEVQSRLAEQMGRNAALLMNDIALKVLK